MDPGSAPKRVLTAHATDEFSDLARHRRPSSYPSPRFPGPEKTEAFSMSSDDGLWFHNDERLTPSWQEPKEQHPDQPIHRPRQRPRRLPLHRGELMPKRKELQLERRTATEGITEF